jgi:hypothetical protein
MPIKDDEGVEVRAGDMIGFTYGIPPVGVDGRVIDRAGKLIVLTRGHKPAECPLHLLRKHVGNFWIEGKPMKKKLDCTLKSPA